MNPVFASRGKGIATLRLGKTSVADIRAICALAVGVQEEASRCAVVCTQVPAELEPGALALVWLGSDNNKGSPTEWKQGFKCVGLIESIERSGSFKDATRLGVSIGYVFRDAINREDLLREAPTSYYWASNMPIIGIDDNANQTVRIIDESLPRNDVRALFHAFERVLPGSRKEIATVYPQLEAVIDYVPPSPKGGAPDLFGWHQCSNDFARPDILAAIRTKPFVLLAGISGTGKSRMVRQLARGCCPRYKAGTAEDHPLYDEQKPGNFEMVQVRPNWHDSAELLGYATRITEDGKPRYVLTDFVRFIAKAWLFPEVPFFVCLDEMNLAPVEQYFAEYLSVVETRRRDGVSRAIRTDVLVRFPPETAARAIGELLAPYEPAARGFAKAEVDALREAWTADGGMRIPSNLVVMGTVNMDETTFSFSRKVLDRAMSFELGGVDMKEGLETAPDAAFGSIPAEAAMASRLKPSEFYEECKELCDGAVAFLEGVNAALEGTPFQIAYRTRDEVLLYCVERTEGGAGLAQALDEAACMKILPRVEGDQKREGVLKALAEAVRSALDAAGDAGRACTKCTGKIGEMREQLREGGYTSFWTQ